jgi:GNAT superfamily N-acetyltransferase
MLIHVDVRDVVPADLKEVAELCARARDESALGTQICVGESDRLERHLGVYAQLPEGHVLVAQIDDEIAGFALIRTVTPGPFVEVPTVYLEAIYVAEKARRRGVGHHLLNAVAHKAVETGAVEVYSLPLPGSRGLQRFLVRLGFAPAGAHRVVSVAALVRNVDSEFKRSKRRSGSRMLDDLIARRRRARIETNSGPLDLRAFQAAYAADRVAVDEQPQQPAQAAAGE